MSKVSREAAGKRRRRDFANGAAELVHSHKRTLQGMIPCRVLLTLGHKIKFSFRQTGDQPGWLFVLTIPQKSDPKICVSDIRS